MPHGSIHFFFLFFFGVEVVSAKDSSKKSSVSWIKEKNMNPKASTSW
jgi:hypothetical protein